VIAFDASREQIASAQRDERVEYRVAPAEATGLLARSLAAITAVQALHWFDLETFYTEARRILQPRGVIGVWAYNDLSLVPDMDALVRRFHDEIVGPCWPPERNSSDAAIANCHFPFDEIEMPTFQIEVCWSLEHLLGYLRTSARDPAFPCCESARPGEI
jgi:SAM-dependent methyltransferase